jgi:hypothetical protein
VWIAGWDGRGAKKLVDGFGLCVWNDPATGKEWLYFSDKAYGVRIDRCPIDSTAHRELVWNRSAVSIRFRVSADGKYGGGEFPWSKAGVVSLPNGTFSEYGSGCNSMIAPDNSYRFYHMLGTHREITMYDSGGTNSRNINLGSAPGVGSRNLWIPKWSNNPRFFTMSGPGGPEGSFHDIYFGEFDSSFTKVEKWLRITDNPDTADIYAYAWVGDASRILFDPAGLEFRIDEGNSSAMQSVKLECSGEIPASVSTVFGEKWLSATVRNSGDSVFIDNTVSVKGMSSGIYSARVTVLSGNQKPAAYTVILRTGGSPELEKLIVFPPSASFFCADTMLFTASGKDQFNEFYSTNVIWSVFGGGSIDSSGLFVTDGKSGSISIIAVSTIDNAIRDTAIVSVFDRIAVFNPKNGDVFETGSNMCVEWVADTASIKDAALAISIDSGFTWQDIASVTVSDSSWGCYCFNIPDSTGVGSDRTSAISQKCRIRLCKYPSDAPFAFSEGVFEIRNRTETGRSDLSRVKDKRLLVRMAGTIPELLIPDNRNYKVSIFDLNGRSLFRKQGSGKLRFMISNVSSFSGVCVLRAEIDGNVFVQHIPVLH